MMRPVYLILLFISSLSTAQVVTDNFTDGNFTSNPAWTGDNAEYTINGSFQLQLNNTVAGASYLSTASPTASLNTNEWRFYIKQTFSGSSSNYGRVYLASNQANLEGSLNGYYLQFGEAGSLDDVELFCQTGTGSTTIVSGIDGEIANSFAIGVKVTRNAAGLWSLYVDAAGGTAYTLAGSATNTTHTTTGYFGVATVYTASNANKFYFDDFYNGPIVVDNTPPAITSVTTLSATTADVLFNENVALSSSQAVSNYSVNNGIGNPSSAVRDATNLSLVHLTFSNPFTNGLSNILTVTNVQDLNANAITTTSASFVYSTSGTPSFHDVLINEIFADPSPQIGLPAFEFVELYNKSGNAFNLNGWKLTDGSSTATLGSYTLASNQYLIICNIADTALFNPFGNTMGVSSFPSLNNTGDNIYLKDNTSAFIDSVGYSDSWYQDATKKQGGWTLELINPTINSSCPAGGNWIASNHVAGGTPGVQNSVYSTASDVTPPTISSVMVVDSLHINVCFSEALNAASLSVLSNYSISNGIGMPVADTINTAFTCVYLTLNVPLISGTTYTLALNNMSDCAGNALTPSNVSFSPYQVQPFDIVINEIMPDPEPIVGTLPGYEYLELYNKTAFPVNLNNWSLVIGTTVKILPNVTIEADSFLVVTSVAAQAEFGNTVALAGLSSISLPNTGQTVILKSPQGAIISAVSYTDDWYQNSSKASGGWSLEQIDPNNPCAGVSNWRASENVNGGTPGKTNSVYTSNPDNAPPQAIRVSVIATDTILLYFDEPLDSATMLNASVYTIDNGIGNPIFVQPLAPYFKSVRLVIGGVLQPGIIYRISVNNAVSDCAGNPIGTSNSARFAIPETALPNDVVINELLADPNTGGVDFVEIYNRSNKVIDLKTMTLSQYDTLTNSQINIEDIAPEGYLLFPQDYLVLSENGSAVKSQYTTINPQGFLDMENLPSFSISEGAVCIATSANSIDLFKYDGAMHFALLNSTKGVSLERIDFDRPTGDRTNWHSAAASVGYATPAYKNSQYADAGEAANAIEVSPEVFSPDEDGINDVVNINYVFSQPGFVANITVFDSKGLIVKNLVRSELLGMKGTFSWDGISNEREKARIGIYILFVEVFDLTGTVKQYKKTCVLGGKL